jgi:hypothetical protein
MRAGGAGERGLVDRGRSRLGGWGNVSAGFDCGVTKG